MPRGACVPQPAHADVSLRRTPGVVCVWTLPLLLVELGQLTLRTIGRHRRDHRGRCCPPSAVTLWRGSQSVNYPTAVVIGAVPLREGIGQRGLCVNKCRQLWKFKRKWRRKFEET